MQVTKCKHLPFDAEKTAYFDRLGLLNSLRGSRGQFWFIVTKQKFIKIKPIQMLCYLCYKHCSNNTEIALITLFFFLSIS